MLIHVNATTGRTLQNLLKADDRLGQDLYFENLTEHGSRTHERAFNVKLWSQNRTTISGATRRRPNPGTGNRFGGMGAYAATFDEWGYFLAALFEADPHARVVHAYSDRADFHERTNRAYLRADYVRCYNPWHLSSFLVNSYRREAKCPDCF
jgi:hypothetical protein